MHDLIQNLVCVRCRKMQRSICPLREEDVVAEKLTEQVLTYCDAITKRHSNLTAADHFYRDLMVYQWRLNALDVQVRAVNAAIHNSDGVSDVAFASDADAPATSVGEILGEALSELEKQQAIAIASFEERASHYALSAPSSAGHLKRFAASASERQVAIDSYRELAMQTFNEVVSEAREFPQMTLQKEALQRLFVTLQRRAAFWQSQLEETWTAWHDVTAQMHSTGDDAMASWQDVVANLEAVCRLLQHETPAKEPLWQALVVFSARGLKVELVNAVGLRGLGFEAKRSEGEEKLADFSITSRARSLSSALKVLRQEGALHKVGMALGEALLDEDTEDAISRVEVLTPRLKDSPSTDDNTKVHQTSLEDAPAKQKHDNLLGPKTTSTPSLADALQIAAAACATPTAVSGIVSQNEQQAVAPETKGIACLLAWLTESLVAAASKAAADNDSTQVIKLLKLCWSLGDDAVTCEVQNAIAQHTKSDQVFKAKFLDILSGSNDSQVQKFYKHLCDAARQEDQLKLSQPPQRGPKKKTLKPSSF